MRSFQFVFWLLFLLTYFLINYGAYRTIWKIIKQKYKNKFKIVFIVYSTLVIVFMILLYIWPGSVREADNYSLYFFFNAFLFIDLFFKIQLSFSSVLNLFFPKKQKIVVSWIGLLLSVCVVILMLYGVFVGKNRISVKYVELKYEHLPVNFKDYKVLHISDIHLGSFVHSKLVLNNLNKKVLELDPDIILMTGDLINNFSNELEGWSSIFESINNRKSFSILGNHDYGNYSEWENEAKKAKNFSELIRVQKQFGFQLLRNENTIISEGKDSIYLIGVENWGHPPFPQYANLEKALEGVPENAFKILMTHDPAHWESQIKGKKNINLTLSGHTHGLQWGIKPGGVTLSLSYLVRKNWGGLYNWNNSYLYVNTGLSTVGIPWRIDMPAEITVITLK